MQMACKISTRLLCYWKVNELRESLIQVENVSFRYHQDDELILKDVSIEAYQGEWLAIIGHNGSGKSTLAKCLNGLLLPESGSVKIRGKETTDDLSIWDIRQQVGIVFQNPDNQFVGTSVRDDVAFGLENHGVPREEMIRRIQESLEEVNMTAFIDQEPHRLSGGQKQRVAIAGVIALQPSIIILDEATSMLDPRGRMDVIETMHRLNKEHGITVISITHDLEEAIDADRIIVMNQGQIVNQGVPKKIFQSPEGLLTIGLDLPFAIKMRQELIQRGLHIPQNVLTQRELVEELWTLHSKI